MIKVLRILNRFNLGGPVYNASYLTSDLSSEFETMLIGGPHEDGEADALYIAHNLGLEPIVIEEMRRSVNPMQDLRALQRIREIIREFKPDIVHTHASKAGALGRIAARLERVPVVVHTYHGHVFHSYFGFIKTSIFKIIERLLAQMTTAIVTISPQQRVEICDIHRIADSKKVHVIPLGFDLQRFDIGNDQRREKFRNSFQLKDEEVAIAIVGRLVPIKNHSLLIRAVGAMKEKKIRLFIVGDGPEKTALTALCDEMQLVHGTDIQNGRVHFIGWHKRIEDILPGFDIVALSSDNEGTPVSLIEAQAAKLPVISTNVGGVSDIVAHGKTGLIVWPKDLTAFISALEQLVSDKEQRIAMGESGQKSVIQAFSKERLACDMAALYRSLL
jgi:glycosyltransferase involved in cell wall biosynthesis